MTRLKAAKSKGSEEAFIRFDLKRNPEYFTLLMSSITTVWAGAIANIFYSAFSQNMREDESSSTRLGAST
jgi:hypothetical protein